MLDTVTVSHRTWYYNGPLTIGTRIYQCTDYRISYYCYHRYMDSRHITVTHACMISIFLSYGSPFILHVILMYSCYMIVSHYCYCYSRYWIHEPLICDVWNPTSIISRFLLSCFVLSTELMLCYRVTCTISCTCSWYTVFIVLHVPYPVLVPDILYSER